MMWPDQSDMGGFLANSLKLSLLKRSLEFEETLPSSLPSQLSGQGLARAMAVGTLMSP